MSYEEDYLLVKVQELEKRIEALEAKAQSRQPRQPAKQANGKQDG